MKNIFITMLKGLWIGGTLTVPGVSGGSMAMILGIYDRLIESVGAFLHRNGDRKKAFFYLLETGGAGAVGFVLFSGLVSMLMERFPLLVCFFFAGAIAGGIPIILKASGMRRPKPIDFVFILIGAAFVYAISLVPDGFFSFSSNMSFGGILLQLLGGFIVAIGFVLPGISLSQMLYMLGIYKELMDNVSKLRFLPLIPFAIGGIAGVLFTAFVMEKVMHRFPRATYLVIFGFLIGSIPQIFGGKALGGQTPWFYVLCGVITLLGFAAICAMSLPELLKKKEV